jgi:Zn-dependent M28 family amino/carboxypeptidase
MLLALAEASAVRPPAHLRLGFLFTGAEETGLHGARAAAARLADVQTGADAAGEVFVLGLDMVGVGDCLRLASGDGVLRRRRADPRLNRRVAAVAAVQPLAYTHRSADFAAFLAAGIPATNLEVTGGAAHDHTAADTAATLDPAACGLAAAAAQQLIAAWDAELAAA